MKNLIAILAFVFAFSAIADEPVDVDAMEAQAFKEYKTKKDFNEKRYGEKVQKAYNNLVKFGVYRLKRQGFTGYKKYETEWKAFNTHFLKAEINIDYVEDHDPAIAWLNDFYLTLVKVLGDTAVKSMRLSDIDVLNRAIPVVFHPKGTEAIDYEDCFVRSSKAFGYWSVLAACSGWNWLGMSPIITICSPLSEGARLAFEYVSKPISKTVWKRANN